MKNEMYIIINTKTGCPIGRNRNYSPAVAVNFDEVKHDENGLTCMVDVLEAMGYTIEGYEYATAKKTSPMSRDRRYNLDDLKMIIVENDTGVIR